MYGEANPDMTNFDLFGHFTQIVWKSTSAVACVTQDCSGQGLANVGGDVAPYFTVCNYMSPGRCHQCEQLTFANSSQATTLTSTVTTSWRLSAIRRRTGTRASMSKDTLSLLATRFFHIRPFFYGLFFYLRIPRSFMIEPENG